MALNTNNPLLSLPEEILSNILSKLSIWDCRKLQRVIPATIFKSIYEDRTSPQLYFGKNMCNGKDIVKLLSETDAYLCGSRALEYFVPGSINENSDWNFYMHYDIKKIYHFMKSMEVLGVTWNYSIVDGILNRKDFITTVNKFKHTVSVLMEEDTKQGVELKEILDTSKIDMETGNMPWIVGWYSTDNKKYTVDKVHSYRDILSSIYSSRDAVEVNEDTTVTGLLNRDNRVVKINLVCSRLSSTTPLMYLAKAPSSATQCFVSAFAAGHMYARMVSEKTFYAWKIGEDKRHEFTVIPTHETRSKYERRGYTCTKHANNTITRNLGDHNSLLITFNKSSKWSSIDWKISQSKFLNFSWKAYNDQLSVLTSREAANTNTRERKYISFIDSLLIKDVDRAYLRLNGIL